MLYSWIYILKTVLRSFRAHNIIWRIKIKSHTAGLFKRFWINVCHNMKTSKYNIIVLCIEVKFVKHLNALQLKFSGNSVLAGESKQNSMSLVLLPIMPFRCAYRLRFQIIYRIPRLAAFIHNIIVVYGTAQWL